MQHEETRTAMTFAGLTAYETWMHYCNMGGSTDYVEFDAYLHGVYDVGPEDADLVSQAVNELIDDAYPVDETLCRAPYSWAGSPGGAPADAWGHSSDAADCGDPDVYLPDLVPVDDLVGPHSLRTFGSRFLAGLDVSALLGRAGVPLPPGAPVELLGEILDSGIIGRIVATGRK